MKTKSKWIEQRDEFFKEKFNKFFKEWKEKDKKKNTQGEFARLICDIREKKTGEKCPVTNSYVSEWARGVWFPDLYLPEIAEVLGVKEEDFFFQTHAEKYERDSAFITEIGKENIEFAKEEGLNIDLIKALSEVVNFDSLFPIYSPIPDRDNSIMPGKRSFGKSAPIDDDFDFLQINRDDKTILFHQCDLAYLKEVQNHVIAFVEFLFYERSKEMKEEAEKFNSEFLKMHPQMDKPEGFKSPLDFQIAWENMIKEEGKEIAKSHTTLISEVWDICQKYDRFMYVFGKKKKTRKATQKDIDLFTSHGNTITENNVTYTKGSE